MTIHWKAVEQYFTVVLFVFQSYPVCHFGKFVSFGRDTVRSERVNFMRVFAFITGCRPCTQRQAFLRKVRDFFCSVVCTYLNNE